MQAHPTHPKGAHGHQLRQALPTGSNYLCCINSEGRQSGNMLACSCSMAAGRPYLTGSGTQRPVAHAGLAMRMPLAHQRRRGLRAADRKCRITKCSAQAQTASRGSQLRFIQHKEEAFVFYRFLSIVYDHIGASRLCADCL